MGVSRDEIRQIRAKNRRDNGMIGLTGLAALGVGCFFYFPAVWLAAASALALLTNIATRNDEDD